METKQKFLQLQFCTLLVVCTLLPGVINWYARL